MRIAYIVTAYKNPDHRVQSAKSRAVCFTMP